MDSSGVLVSVLMERPMGQAVHKKIMCDVTPRF